MLFRYSFLRSPTDIIVKLPIWRVPLNSSQPTKISMENSAIA